MNKQAGNDKDLNEGLDYVKDLPGYNRGPSTLLQGPDDRPSPGNMSAIGGGGLG